MDMKIARAALLLPLLLTFACSDPNAPRLPSPQDERRQPTRQPTRGLEGPPDAIAPTQPSPGQL